LEGTLANTRCSNNVVREKNTQTYMVCKEASWIEGHKAKGTSKFWELRKIKNCGDSIGKL
jgi:hypothetical protein